MKKRIVLVLTALFVFLLTGCSGGEEAIWDWAQNLNQEDIISAIPRTGVDSDDCQELEPLDETETLELVALLNNLTKDDFTHNKHLRGITPAFHIEVQVGSETYYINEANAPDGALEMKFRKKQWWIDSDELMAFVQRVTDNAPAE